MGSRFQRPVQHFARVILVAGVAVLAHAAYLVLDAHEFQTIQHSRFERERQHAAVVTALVDGDPIGEIEIKRLGMTVSVLEGESPLILRRAVGHLVDTPLPGEVGNVVLAGHRDTFFRPLKGVQIGDEITMKTRDRDVMYRVESTHVVPADDLGVLDPTGGHTLTLITCFPFSYLGSAPDRFVVLARQVGY